MTDEKQIEEKTETQSMDDLPLNPESEKILYRLKELIDAGDKEGIRDFFEELKVINRDTGDRKPEKIEGMTGDRIFEYLLDLFQSFLPEVLRLKWMIRLDGKFLMARSVRKAGDDGQQLNVGGMYIINPPGEKKGRLYLPPTKQGKANIYKLIMMVSNDYPVRARRFLLNQKRLNELKGAAHD